MELEHILLYGYYIIFSIDYYTNYTHEYKMFYIPTYIIIPYLKLKNIVLVSFREVYFGVHVLI